MLSAAQGLLAAEGKPDLAHAQRPAQPSSTPALTCLQWASVPHLGTWVLTWVCAPRLPLPTSPFLTAGPARSTLPPYSASEGAELCRVLSRPNDLK